MKAHIYKFICKECNGKGEILKHNAEYDDEWYDTCPVCKGTGKQRMKLERIPDTDLINAFDTTPDFGLQLRNLADAQLSADQKILDSVIQEKDVEIENGS